VMVATLIVHIQGRGTVSSLLELEAKIKKNKESQ
jgi:hypothetical protein